MSIGDVVVRINDIPTSNLSYYDAHQLLACAGNRFVLGILRLVFWFRELSIFLKYYFLFYLSVKLKKLAKAKGYRFKICIQSINIVSACLVTGFCLTGLLFNWALDNWFVAQ